MKLQTVDKGDLVGPIAACFTQTDPVFCMSVPEAYCFLVCPSVSESVNESSCEFVRPENTICQKPTNRISFNFDHRCILVHRRADYILGSKGQRSRSQQAMIRETGWIQYLRSYWIWSYNFTKIRSYAPGPGHTLIRFSGLKVKGQSHSRRRYNCRWHYWSRIDVRNLVEISVI